MELVFNWFTGSTAVAERVKFTAGASRDSLKVFKVLLKAYRTSNDSFLFHACSSHICNQRESWVWCRLSMQCMRIRKKGDLSFRYAGHPSTLCENRSSCFFWVQPKSGHGSHNRAAEILILYLFWAEVRFYNLEGG